MSASTVQPKAASSECGIAASVPLSQTVPATPACDRPRQTSRIYSLLPLLSLPCHFPRASCAQPKYFVQDPSVLTLECMEDEAIVVPNFGESGALARVHRAWWGTFHARAFHMRVPRPFAVQRSSSALTQHRVQSDFPQHRLAMQIGHTSCGCWWLVYFFGKAGLLTRIYYYYISVCFDWRTRRA